MICELANVSRSKNKNGDRDRSKNTSANRHRNKTDRWTKGEICCNIMTVKIIVSVPMIIMIIRTTTAIFLYSTC
jgi:hypothetical protein